VAMEHRTYNRGDLTPAAGHHPRRPRRVGQLGRLSLGPAFAQSR
jgi:hypothetical protein